MLKQHANNNEFEHHLLRRILEATLALTGENFLTELPKKLNQVF